MSLSTFQSHDTLRNLFVFLSGRVDLEWLDVAAHSELHHRIARQTFILFFNFCVLLWFLVSVLFLTLALLSDAQFAVFYELLTFNNQVKALVTDKVVHLSDVNVLFVELVVKGIIIQIVICRNCLVNFPLHCFDFLLEFRILRPRLLTQPIKLSPIRFLAHFLLLFLFFEQLFAFLLDAEQLRLFLLKLATNLHALGLLQQFSVAASALVSGRIICGHVIALL